MERKGAAYLAMESKNILDGHLRWPGGGCQDEAMASPCLFGIGAQFLGLSGGLSTGASNDENVLESILVEGLACEGDGLLSLLMREVLCFAV
jgi:hypothetical protein